MKTSNLRYYLKLPLRLTGFVEVSPLILGALIFGYGI